MFYGLYEHSLDNKGRVCVPSKFRGQCNDKLYIMKGFDGALSLFCEDDFKKMLETSQNLPFNKKDSRDYLRIQLATACELDIDKNGRILIPLILLNKYKIGKDVVIIGVGNHIEIWDRNVYQEYEQQVNANFENIAENIQNIKDE